MSKVSGEMAMAQSTAMGPQREALSRMLDQKLDEHSDGLDDFLSKVHSRYAARWALPRGVVLRTTGAADTVSSQCIRQC